MSRFFSFFPIPSLVSREFQPRNIHAGLSKESWAHKKNLQEIISSNSRCTLLRTPFFAEVTPLGIFAYFNLFMKRRRICAKINFSINSRLQSFKKSSFKSFNVMGWVGLLHNLSKFFITDRCNSCHQNLPKAFFFPTKLVTCKRTRQFKLILQKDPNSGATKAH